MTAPMLDDWTTRTEITTAIEGPPGRRYQDVSLVETAPNPDGSTAVHLGYALEGPDGEHIGQHRHTVFAISSTEAEALILHLIEHTSPVFQATIDRDWAARIATNHGIRTTRR